LVVVFCGCDNTNPVTEGVLLQELLREIFEVPLGEGDVGGDGDAHIAVAGDLDIVTELTGLSLYLDTIMEVLLEGSTVEDTVTSRTGVINDELVLSSSLSGSGLGL